MGKPPLRLVTNDGIGPLPHHRRLQRRLMNIAQSYRADFLLKVMCLVMTFHPGPQCRGEHAALSHRVDSPLRVAPGAAGAFVSLHYQLVDAALSYRAGFS